jgi:predicted nuclease of predicted toxin-antitoxin system
MRFLVDAQLPPALARWLGEHGCAVTPVRDIGLRESDDGSIRNFAIQGDWVLITKDEDLVDRWLSASEGPPIVWLRIGNCTNRVLFNWLEPLWPEVRKQLESGQRIVEVKRVKPSD